MASNTTFTSGQILTATMQNNLEWGVPDATSGGTSSKCYVKRTANYTLTSSEALVTGMTCTFTAVANRLYRVSFHGYVLKNTGTSQVYANIKQTVGASVSYISTGVMTMASGEYATFDISGMLVGLAAGATTIEITAQYDPTAGGTFTASATNPSWMWIEDIGAA